MSHSEAQPTLMWPTRESLLRFHESHLQSKLPPPLSHPSLGFEASSYSKPTESSESEVDLGLYPDGKQRTLTDEQVAIFRHTEIQELKKARERDEGSSQPSTSSDRGSDNTSPGANKTSPPLYRSSRPDDSNEEHKQTRVETSQASDGQGIPFSNERLDKNEKEESLWVTGGRGQLHGGSPATAKDVPSW